ncbi:hypothetical protein CRE_06504 [Caenorhabditis remanei]|uniref:Uncharacterized protein n=1 Tax=Caenorhabditis remanei TaxID=31234 RepID=E3M173_CAERE|nr:hypothetical protein CRE_06504 [Caenorhabditis remanei]
MPAEVKKFNHILQQPKAPIVQHHQKYGSVIRPSNDYFFRYIAFSKYQQHVLSLHIGNSAPQHYNYNNSRFTGQPIYLPPGEFSLRVFK